MSEQDARPLPEWHRWVLNECAKQLPPEAHDIIKVGSEYFPYIKIGALYHRLSQIFGLCWEWTVEESQLQVVWSRWRVWNEETKRRDDVDGDRLTIRVRGTLTVYDDQGRAYRKMGMGLTVQQSPGDDLDKLQKAAEATALKRAAGKLGIGAYLKEPRKKQAIINAVTSMKR